MPRGLGHVGHLATFSVLVFLALSGLGLSIPRHGMPSDLAWFIDCGQRFAAGTTPYVAAAPNLNPPTALPLYILLAYLDGPYMGWVWFVVNLSAYSFALVALFRTYLPRPTLLEILWPLSIAPLWEMGLGLGNLYPLLCLLAVLIAVPLERQRSLVAGLLLGLLIALKPNFVVLPVLLFLSGHRRPSVWAGFSALVLALLPLIAFGPDPYLQWLGVVTGPAWYAAVANISLYGAAVRTGFPSLGMLASAAIGLLAAWFAATRRPDAPTVSIAGTGLALLLSPLAWPGYALPLLPFFFVYRPWTRLIRTVAVLIMVPAYALYALWHLLPNTIALIGWLYLVVLVMVLVEITRRAQRVSLQPELNELSKLHEPARG